MDRYGQAVVRFRTFPPRASAAVVGLAGSVALMGWLLDSHPLKGLIPGAVAMNPMTAVAFILAAASLWHFGPDGGTPRERSIRKWLAAALVLVAALKLVELFGLDVGVDRLLFRGALDVAVPPNRMAPNTALCFLLVGAALLVIDLDAPRARLISQGLALGSAFFALPAVIGYLYHTAAFFGFASFIPMALNTALAFLILAVGIIFLRPRDGLMARITADSPGGALMRTLLPAVIVLPIVLGWLILAGLQRGWYGPDFVTPLSVVSTLVVFLPMLWWTAGSLDRAERERAKLRRDADRARGTLEGVVGSMTDGLLVLDPRLGLRYGNGQAAEIFGLDLESANGRSLATLPDSIPALVNPRAAESAWERGLAGVDERPNFEFSLVGPPRRDILVQVFPVADANGKRLAVGLLLRDVTAERDLARTKDELLSVVSHELRTPLASLVGFAELLLARDFSAAQRQQYLTVMLQEGRRLAALINDFLDLQRMESGRFEIRLAPTDPHQVLERAVATAGDDPQHPTELDVPADLSLIQADADRVLQVLANLLSNARKYSPRGGPVRLAARAADGAVEFSVQDSGLGLPPEALPNLFQKFYRVNNSDRREIKGTGLGLAICRQLVEAQGGRIWAESEGQDTGSTFRFTLPVAASVAAGGDVLIVEDDAGFARLLTAELSVRGITTTHATTAEAALVQLGALRPRVILLDLRLPGMQGETFLRRVRDIGGTDIPVIVVTVKDLEAADQQVLEDLRAVAVLRKGPGAADEAARSVEEVLRGVTASGSHEPSGGGARAERPDRGRRAELAAAGGRDD